MWMCNINIENIDDKTFQLLFLYLIILGLQIKETPVSTKYCMHVYVTFYLRFFMGLNSLFFTKVKNIMISDIEQKKIPNKHSVSPFFSIQSKLRFSELCPYQLNCRKCRASIFLLKTQCFDCSNLEYLWPK